MLTNRLGNFFILLGLGVIGYFVLTDIAKTPACDVLIIGVILVGLGIVLWLRNPGPPPQETGRFRILRSSGKKQDKK